MPARHLDIKNGEIGGAVCNPSKGGRAVGIGVDAIAFGLQCNGHRGQDIAVRNPFLVIELGR